MDQDKSTPEGPFPSPQLPGQTTLQSHPSAGHGEHRPSQASRGLRSRWLWRGKGQGGWVGPRKKQSWGTEQDSWETSPGKG